MNVKATFPLIIGLLLVSLPVLAGPPADAGVTRTYITGTDDWAITNPVSMGTIRCPGGELDFDDFGMPYCANSNTGRLHFRDSVFWSCITSTDSLTNEIDTRMTGVARYVIWGNFDAESTGAVGGTWQIVPTADCDKLGPYPEELLATASEYWFGTWNGKRSYREFGESGFWVGEFRIVGKGYGGALEGLHFNGEEVIPTYTPFPVPYEFLPPVLGLYDVPEGALAGTITE